MTEELLAAAAIAALAISDDNDPVEAGPPSKPPGRPEGPENPRPSLPDPAPALPGGPISNPDDFAPNLNVRTGSSPLVPGLPGLPPLVNDGRGSVTGASFQQATKPPEDDPVDTDGDGVQSPEEIQAYIDKLREEEFERQRQENDGFHPADTNQDGTIDAREYIAYYGVPEEELDEDGTGIIADDMTADPEDPDNEGLVGNGGGGLRATPNLSFNIQDQIEAWRRGRESCFEDVMGSGWSYRSSGRVLEATDYDEIGGSRTSANIALVIKTGYQLRLLVAIDRYSWAKPLSETDYIDQQYVRTGGGGEVTEAWFQEDEYASIPMTGGDYIQIDIDGTSEAIGDFRISSLGTEVTRSRALNDDVYIAIDPNSVSFDENRERVKPIPQPPAPINGDDEENGNGNGNGNGSSGRMSPLSVVLVLAGLGAFIYFLVTKRKGGGE
jgi:hypothetical protein